VWDFARAGYWNITANNSPDQSVSSWTNDTT
jgi:hypothetical protein